MASVTSARTHYLSWVQRAAYSVGHVFNDLCAAFWFTYLLIFMRKVNGFRPETAGTLMLVGQVADGLATPFIGLECDKNFSWWICRYGKRKTWHLLGSVCVLMSFPFIFNLCWGCHDSSESAQVIYYSAFIVIFQFGWASCQISHLSLIPDLTPISSERIELNAYRYAFTVFSNIAVFVMMWIALDQNKDDAAGNQISIADAATFKYVSFLIVGIGALFSGIFHVGVRERNAVRHDSDGEEDSEVDYDTATVVSAASNGDLRERSVSQDGQVCSDRLQLKWRHWFFVPQFYMVGVLYMGTRLTINMTQVYIPQYLQDTLLLNKNSIAYIPLVIYSSGFVSSFVMKYINTKLGKKWTYLLGSGMFLSAAVWIYLDESSTFKSYGIFAVAVLIGLSSSTQLITSLGITNDLIGSNTSSGAFVFGAMSLLDKISNGVGVMLVQLFKPSDQCKEAYCEAYYRNVLTFVCGGSTLLALLGLGLLSRMGRIGGHSNKSSTPAADRRHRRRKRHHSRRDSSTSPLLSSGNDQD